MAVVTSFGNPAYMHAKAIVSWKQVLPALTVPMLVNRVAVEFSRAGPGVSLNFSFLLRGSQPTLAGVTFLKCLYRFFQLFRLVIRKFGRESILFSGKERTIAGSLVVLLRETPVMSSNHFRRSLLIAIGLLWSVVSSSTAAPIQKQKQSGPKFPKQTSVQGQGMGGSKHGHAGGQNSNGHSDGGHSDGHNGSDHPSNGYHYTQRPDYSRSWNSGGSARGGSQLYISPYGLGFSYSGRGINFSTGGSGYYQPTLGTDYGYGLPNPYGAIPGNGYYNGPPNGYGYDPGFNGYPQFYPNVDPGYSTSQPYNENYGPVDPALGAAYGDPNMNPALRSGSVPMNAPKLAFPVILTKAAALSSQQRAEAAFRDGRYEEAARLARQSALLDQENGLVFLFASQTQFAIGNYDQAAADLLAATELLPSDQWSKVVKNFRAFYGQNDYVTQTDRLTQHLVTRPDDFNARTIRGFHYGSLGYLSSAKNDFLLALSVNPNDRLTNRLLPVLGEPSKPISTPRTLEEPVPQGIIPQVEQLPLPGGLEEIESLPENLPLNPQAFTDLRLSAPAKDFPAPNLTPATQADSVLELDGPHK